MTQWRYATITARQGRDKAVMLVAGETGIVEGTLGALLTQAGLDGWEMVGMAAPERGWQVFAFKQPLPEVSMHADEKPEPRPQAGAETPEPATPQADAPLFAARKPGTSRLPAPKRPARGAKKAPR